MGPTRLLWILLIFSLAAAGGAYGLPPVGQSPPAFSAQELGSLQPVSSETLVPAGSVTLVSFFATWCKPCEREIPELRKLAERFADRGFRVVLVSLDQLEAGEILEFLAGAGAGTLPAVWDEEGELMSLFGVFALPANLLVGKDGHVAMAWQGYLPAKLRELEARLEKLKVSR